MSEYKANLSIIRYVSRMTTGLTLGAIRQHLRSLLTDDTVLGRVGGALTAIGILPADEAATGTAATPRIVTAARLKTVIEGRILTYLLARSGSGDGKYLSQTSGALTWAASTAYTDGQAVDAVEAEVSDGIAVVVSGVLGGLVGSATGDTVQWSGSAWTAAQPAAPSWTSITGKPSTFAPSSHTHTASEITDFATAWTAQFTAFGSGASVNDVPKWNGSAWVAGAQSGGGMTNPMTSDWDLIRGGASGTPTRLAVGSPLTRLSVLPDGTLGYAVGGGRITPGARESIWYTTATAPPTTIGSIPWSRVSTSNTAGVQCKQNGSVYQINGTAASTNSHATIGATLVSGLYWIPAYATVYMQTHGLATTSTVGLYLATAATVSSNEFFNAPPTANAASSAKQGFGLMWSSADGLTGTFKFIATTTTEYGVVDTGVQWTTDGVTVRDLALMIWQGPTAVYGEIWDMGGASPVRLWGGSLPIVSFATTGLQIVAWSLTKTLAASAAYIVHGMGSAGYTTGLEAA